MESWSCCFVDWVKGNYYEMNADEDIPEAKDLAPLPELIGEAVCDEYHINRHNLYTTKRGELSEARNVAVFLMRRLRYDSLKQIGRHFHMVKYSSVSSIIERMEKQLSKDSKRIKRVGKVSAHMSQSQEQTWPFRWTRECLKMGILLEILIASLNKNVLV